MIRISPPPKDSLKELQQVIHQFHNRINPPRAQNMLDKNIAGLFAALLSRHGIPNQFHKLKRRAKATLPIILALKLYYNRDRPQEYADKLNIPIKFDYLKSAQTRSYPSGHSTQAYYLAIKLSKKYPKLKPKLFRLAHAISSSRMDRGVHYPSDLDGGYELAMILSKIF